MKIAAVFCVYNEEEYIEYALRAILPGVDRVVVCLGTAPYIAYNPKARENFTTDRTGEILDRIASKEPKIRVIKGVWDSEIDHRNEGLRACLEDGADYYWLVDGDEVYRQDHLQTIREEIQRRPEVGTFIIKCHIFWRSFSYRIRGHENPWRPRRIFKLTRKRLLLGMPFPYGVRFTGENQTNSLGPVYEFHADRAVFYHFSYARSSKAMADKFRTFSHAHQIKQDWVANVWDKWPSDRQMENVHPIDPPKFPRVIQQPPDDLPAIMRSHPYYGLDLIP